MGNGVKSWMTKCKVCGRLYRYTNFQWRYVREKDGDVVRMLEHEVKCNGLTAMTADETMKYKFDQDQLFRRA